MENQIKESPESWVKTMQLRWLKTENGITLQQLEISDKGNLRFRHLPIVELEAATKKDEEM